jgi:hypothetical protein
MVPFIHTLYQKSRVTLDFQFHIIIDTNQIQSFGGIFYATVF